MIRADYFRCRIPNHFYDMHTHTHSRNNNSTELMIVQLNTLLGPQPMHIHSGMMFCTHSTTRTLRTQTRGHRAHRPLIRSKKHEVAFGQNQTNTSPFSSPPPSQSQLCPSPQVRLLRKHTPEICDNISPNRAKRAEARLPPQCQTA